jgi:hypothetical protein
VAKPPPIREGERHIEIDVRKGAYPFVRFERAHDGRLLIVMDSNEAGQVMGEGRGVAAMVLSKKKSRAIERFLRRTDP